MGRRHILALQRKRRGSIRITQDGIIAGGLADKEHQRRCIRLDGAKKYWDICIERKCIIIKSPRMFFVKRLPKLPWREKAKIAERRGGGDFEVGMGRAEDFLFGMIGKHVSQKKVDGGFERHCGYPSGGVFQTMNSVASRGKVAPKPVADEAFQARRKRGEV